MTPEDKKTIENLCIGALIGMFILLVIASLWLNVKYNDLVVEHNKALEINNQCFNLCPAMMEDNLNGDEHFGPFRINT